ncbi:hypothetical protein GCM10025865_26710 [Paraoerskovia sediminicola]|uniref:DUF3093 domain-containing protein n=2 Tax=Paraoerskovia sediminicola TaxID=1138587 RepID=A0ABN6XEL4_9CELL|nr:hypothetical protein GCM10025865_26710 [Paraoerskovia sediminicola]
MPDDVAPAGAPASGTPRHQERLRPGPGVFAAALGLGVFVALSTIPLGTVVAGTATVLAIVAAAALVWWTSPLVVVDDELRAGRARIPVALLGESRVLRGDELREQLGPGLDARAYVCLRAWTRAAVRVEVTDPADPTPYWIVSTRRPEDLVRALSGGAAERPVAD